MEVCVPSQEYGHATSLHGNTFLLDRETQNNTLKNSTIQQMSQWETMQIPTISHNGDTCSEKLN